MSVKVSWQDPAHNYEAIDRYQILFKLRSDSGETFAEEVDNCDGSNQIIFIRKTCEVPVSVLVSEDYPFRLQAGDLVVVKVAAHNLNGWGPFSDVNTVGA